ncbi:MAG TPA: formylmethanofuran dehydrogenase subunit E family protein [Desulfobacterales bacterium]|jgi:formylmethanofuran dehydrogenase subunit E|nr:formylmethanofuran dehydrogenase subunit E family protein [Desulfobacterales bacterium]
MNPSISSNSAAEPKASGRGAAAVSPPQDSWCRDHRGRRFSYDQALELIRGFHGHLAPGLVIGVKMVSLAMARLPRGVIFDALCETRSCLPDAVQLLTPCTIGNGWLRIVDLGRFAVALYDKTDGSGVRVFIDAAKLQAWPEFDAWLHKRKPKQEQDAERLFAEIHAAGKGVLGVRAVRVAPRFLGKQSKGPIAICPVCGEPYPLSTGGICKGCQGEAPYIPSGPEPAGP